MESLVCELNQSCSPPAKGTKVSAVKLRSSDALICFQHENTRIGGIVDLLA